MRNKFPTIAITAALLLFSAKGWVCAEPEAAAEDDTAQGLGPKQMNQWMETQLDYSHALQKYGKGSPEATQAEVAMNTLARELGIKPTGEAPQFAPMAPPPPVDNNDREVAISNEVPLNAPAPTTSTAPEPVLQESGTPSKN